MSSSRINTCGSQITNPQDWNRSLEDTDSDVKIDFGEVNSFDNELSVMKHDKEDIEFSKLRKRMLTNG
jgi:hypothetical protein